MPFSTQGLNSLSHGGVNGIFNMNPTKAMPSGEVKVKNPRVPIKQVKDFVGLMEYVLGIPEHEFPKHLEKMRQNAVHGEVAEIIVMANLLKKTIGVVHYNQRDEKSSAQFIHPFFAITVCK